MTSFPKGFNAGDAEVSRRTQGIKARYARNTFPLRSPRILRVPRVKTFGRRNEARP
jgi:hypothetical protein